MASSQAGASTALHTLGRRVWRMGLDFLFPPACTGCGRLGWHFCPECAQAVKPTPSTICARCGRVLAHSAQRCEQCRTGLWTALTIGRAAALFSAPLRQGIHAFKYEGRTELAEALARYLVVAFAEPVWADRRAAIHAVVPVPLHSQRSAERGYNQSELLARVFAQRCNLACRPDWILRTRFTRPQVGLDRPARRENVTDAFHASPHVAGKTILLIDDVFTTGATLQACGQAARDAGATAVYGLTLAAAWAPGADRDDVSLDTHSPTAQPNK